MNHLKWLKVVIKINCHIVIKMQDSSLTDRVAIAFTGVAKVKMFLLKTIANVVSK